MNFHKKFNWIAVFTSCAILVATGCGDAGPTQDAIVQGTVTIEGQLAKRGAVTFHPVAGGPIATGPIHTDGSFSLRIGQGNLREPDQSKIPSGKYVATVVVNAPADRTTSIAEGGPPPPGTRLSAAKYARQETSGLELEVEPGRNVFNLDLESSSNDPPIESAQEVEDEAEETELPESLESKDAVQASDGSNESTSSPSSADEQGGSQ